MTAPVFHGAVDCGMQGELILHATAEYGGTVYMTSGIAVMNLPPRAAALLAAGIRQVVNAGPDARDQVVLDLRFGGGTSDVMPPMQVYRVLRHIWIGHAGMAWRLLDDEARALCDEIDEAVAWVERQQAAQAVAS